MKRYNVITTGRPVVPRSKRLRDAGFSQTPGGTTVIAAEQSSSQGNGDGHTHSNKAALDAISIDNDNYLYLKQKPEDADDSETSKVKAGYADKAGATAEADHAKEADHATEADHAKDSDRWSGHVFKDYLDQPVREEDIVRFLAVIADAFMTTNYQEGESGACIDEEGNGEFKNLLVREVAQLTRAIVDIISSRNFVSGFPEGKGWAITPREVENAAGVKQTKYELEIDDIVARGTMRVYEFIISQLLGMNGSHMVTDMMRVDHIDPETHTIFLDTDGGVLYNPFRAGDLLMVQQFSQGDTIIKQYQLQVETASVGNTADGENRLDRITYTNFVGDVSTVAARDVLTRVDSATDSDRKGTIKMTSVESGSPYIDVIYGMLTDPDNSLRLRLGRLTGIITYLWGQLSGYGLYSDNAYLTGEFRLRNGKDVRTQFDILEGKIQSAMQSLVNTFQEEDNYLSNATFKDELRDWAPADTGAMYMVGDGLLDIVSGYYSDKEKVAEAVEYDGRLMLRIKDSSIVQANASIRKPENLEDNKLYLTIKYRCEEPGTLTAGFQGTDIFISRQLQATDDFATIEVSGRWDGTGDFRIAFTGDIYIETLMLTNHPLEDYKKEVSTQFEQTAEHILAVATRVTSLETASAGWITTADGNRLWASKTLVDEQGQVLARHTTELLQTAEQISAMATRVTNLETASAGWITTADGNRLWASLDSFNELTGTVDNHSTQISNNATSITSVASRVTSLETASSGWITTADGNTLWASKSLESGDSIISYINQSATTLTISASRINISGAVTFSAFDSSLQNTINGKADSSSLGALAGKSSVAWSDLAAALQSSINGKADSSSLGSLAGKSSVSWSDLAAAIQSIIDGKANSSSLGALAGKDVVSLSDLGSTIIVGGYLKTTLINAEALVVGVIDTAPSATKNKTRIDGDGLSTYDGNGYRKIRIDNKTVGMYEDLMFERNLNYLSSGLSKTRNTGVYVYTAQQNIYFGGELFAFLNLGYCDKNSVIRVDSIAMNIAFTCANANVHMYMYPTQFVCALYKDGEDVASMNVSVSPINLTGGQSTSVTITPSFNYTVTEDGTYTIRVYTTRNSGPVMQTSNCYMYSSSGGATTSIDITSVFKFSLSRTNYEYTHIGDDGLMQVMSNGLLFSNGSEFVVRRGRNMLRLSTDLGIQKSTDGGTTWSSL